MRYVQRLKLFGLFLWGMCLVSPGDVRAASEPYIGEIMMTGANFCPRGWTNADGQLLPISQNQALFSLVGTTYGGDGRTTFGLPDLRGRVPIHPGNSPGLSSRRQGEKGGEERHTLTLPEIPVHQHGFHAANGKPTEGNAGGNFLSGQAKKSEFVAPGAGPLTALHPGTVGSSGGGQGHNVMQPYLGIRFCIALTGLFPPRN